MVSPAMSDPKARPPVDEFDHIARLLRPLAAGAPEALGLLDDAAILQSRPGQDLVVTTDTLVEGVHFLPSDSLDMVARKLLRVNLSDLAAKAAAPYGYFLCASWSPRCGWDEREAFAAGLAADQAAFGIVLMGGDTTSTPGPLTFSLTAMGWAQAGETVKRSGARPGHRLLVSGTIGDGSLGLAAATGGLAQMDVRRRAALADRYRLPHPRLELRAALLAYASAAADVSDGLIADAGHIAEASGCAVAIELGATPLSEAAAAWVAGEPNRAVALAKLASGGDDYEIVLAAPADACASAVAAAKAAGVVLTEIGRFEEGAGVGVQMDGQPYAAPRAGYRHL